jgi:nucleoside-diphosphate-sugar epimerase
LPSDDPERRKPDISAAQALLGWNPIIDLEKGLAQTIDYFSHRLSREGGLR